MAEFARRVGFGVMVVALAFVGTARAEKEKENDHDKDDKITPSTAHGTNFQIKSQVDNNFCVQVGSGTNEGRTVTLQQCSSADAQRWAFTYDKDETNLIVETNGMCLDSRAVKPNTNTAVPVMKCQFGEAWRYTYTASGLIKDVKLNKCLSVPGAAANAAVSLADCDEKKKGQLWKLSK